MLPITLYSVSLIQSTSGQGCSFPSSLHGTWLSSNLAVVTVSDTRFSYTKRTAASSSGLVLNCFIANQTHYVVRSPESMLINVPFDDGYSDDRYVYGCLQVLMNNTNRVMYRQPSVRGQVFDPLRFVALRKTIQNISMSTICSETLPDREFDTLLRAGHVTHGPGDQACPQELHGMFQFLSCPSVYISSCGVHAGHQLKLYTLEHAHCPDDPFSFLFTSDGELGCVSHTYEAEGNRVHVMLYNFDSKLQAGSHRFLCLTVSKSIGTLEITSYPNGCYTSGLTQSVEQIDGC